MSDSLEQAENVFTEEKHRELDHRVNAAIDWEQGKPFPSWSVGPVLFAGFVLLPAIIRNSDGLLDTKYTQPERMFALFDKHHDALIALLTQAWREGQYEAIRNLAILRSPQPTQETRNEQHDAALLKSFQEPFRGSAVEGFYEYLTHNNKLFSGNKDRYYGRFCSIVQSSGTGKSRLITELHKKNVLVLYMNLRPKTDTSGFPLRDNIPARLLTEGATDKEKYASSCCAFWIAIFDTLKVDLQEILQESNGDATLAIRSWNEKMCDMGSSHRDRFFTRVEHRFDQVQRESASRMPLADRKEKSPIQEAADMISDLSLDGSSKKNKSSELPGEVELQRSYGDMITALRAVFVEEDGQIHQPKLVFGLDEASTLCDKMPGNWRRADVLCRTITMFSEHADHVRDSVWVVFASTTSRVADFAASQLKHSSARVVIAGKLLFVPYTDLGWDQFATKLRSISANEAAQFRHIVGFGRPLWTSLRNIRGARGVMEIAAFKLDGRATVEGKHDGRTDDNDYRIAIVAQRFGLDISFGHPEAVAYLEAAVASYLRVCVSVTSDRVWKYTRYPSEPLLSCAAAQAMHSSPQFLEACLGTLQEKVNNGMIDKGQRGELASRLLWLLGKDFYVRDRLPSNDWLLPNHGHQWETAVLKDCCMIPVVDFLTFLFGERVWLENSDAKDKFAKAFVNFSHWLSMDVSIGEKDVKENRLQTDEWTLRHWCRSSALQCFHQQYMIDKVIPIYFDYDGPHSPDADAKHVSHIFISDKARTSSNASTLKFTSRSELSISTSSVLPYIVILVDMGLEKSSFDVSFPEPPAYKTRNPPKEDPCLRIYAAGMHVDTFPFLAQHSKVLEILQDLVQPRPLADGPSSWSLRQQVLYGSTPEKDHMEWERSSQPAS